MRPEADRTVVSEPVRVSGQEHRDPDYQPVTATISPLS